MTAIIRIKRNCTDDPFDAVVLNCKKRKLNEDTRENVDISTVLNFAGTVPNTDEDVLKHIKKLGKTEIQEQYKKHTVDIANKLRAEKETQTKNSRYKVINSHRFSNINPEDTDCDLNCTIVDVEAEKSEGENVKDYVYDLYYTNSDDFGDSDLNEFISVYPLSEGLVYGSYRDNGYNDPESDFSEDSNAENHWRNDYPDESDVESDYNESVTEEDMLRNMKKVALCGDDDLSSDNYSAEDNEHCDESCTP